MTKVQEKDWYKKAEADYNRMARLWNTLPGSKLYKDKDKFTITYCYHKPGNRIMAEDKNGRPFCSRCGYHLPFAYDAA